MGGNASDVGDEAIDISEQRATTGEDDPLVDDV
ncbi:MAG: hypothetical protein RLY63_149, partial [Chloroflexota bacterium]